jgi:hypothetical protein
MSINKYNSEGYPDPTAYEALTAVQREETKKPYRPLVFVCSPLAGAVAQNLENARRYSRFAVDQGMIPVTPHLLYPQFLDDTNTEERQLGSFFGLVLLRKCEELWVFGSVISKGMRAEIAKARKHGMKIRFFNEKCEEVATE